MEGFIVLLAIGGFIYGIIYLIIKSSKKKKKEEIEALYRSVGYHFAIKVREELINNGYYFGISDEPSVSYDDLGYSGKVAVGCFWIYPSKGSDSIGVIRFCAYPAKLSRQYGAYWALFAAYGNNYVIDVSLGIFISTERGNKVDFQLPEFMNIAADVIKREAASYGYEMKQPKFYNEYPKTREFVNVMF